MDPCGWQVFEKKSHYMEKTIRYYCPEPEGFVHDKVMGRKEDEAGNRGVLCRKPLT